MHYAALYNRIRKQTLEDAWLDSLNTKVRQAVETIRSDWPYMNRMCNRISEGMSHEIVAVIPWLVKDALNTEWPESHG
jgi:hypothetical protein